MLSFERDCLRAAAAGRVYTAGPHIAPSPVRDLTKFNIILDTSEIRANITPIENVVPVSTADRTKIVHAADAPPRFSADTRCSCSATISSTIIFVNRTQPVTLPDAEHEPGRGIGMVSAY